VNIWLGWPLELRLLLIALVAAAATRAVNRLVDRYERSVLGEPSSLQAASSSLASWLPWGPLPSRVGPHALWWRWSLIELIVPVFFTLLYVWQCHQFRLWPVGAELAPQIQLVVHQQYAAQCLLLLLMLAASLIDLDERIIPDGIAVLGTLAGLALAVL